MRPVDRLTPARKAETVEFCQYHIHAQSSPCRTYQAPHQKRNESDGQTVTISIFVSAFHGMAWNGQQGTAWLIDRVVHTMLDRT